MTPQFRKKHSIDDLVHYVTLHKVNPMALRAIVWPFVALYMICLAFIYQTDAENYEFGFIALAAIGCIHILTVLCCYWSVHIAAFLNCRKVTNHVVSIFHIFPFIKTILFNAIVSFTRISLILIHVFSPSLFLSLKRWNSNCRKTMWWQRWCRCQTTVHPKWSQSTERS